MGEPSTTPGEKLRSREEAEHRLVDALVALRCGLDTHALVLSAMAVVHLKDCTSQAEAVALVQTMRAKPEDETAAE